MGAAAIPGYEVTPFLASMFRNEAALQLSISIIGWFRADDPLVQFAYVLTMVLAGTNYVYNYLTIGIPLTTVLYVFAPLITLIALPKVPRCW